MTQISLIKNSLIDNLWIPMLLRSAPIFRPRLKRNREMKVFTLTSDDNLQEVTKLIENKLSRKQLITAWNHDHFKVIRLDTEGKTGKVLGATRYEDSVANSNHPVFGLFPFDVVNLDFSSQDPEQENGRIEKEIISVERTINLQKTKGTNQGGFVLLYTTSLNSKAIDVHHVMQGSNSISIPSWSGIRLSGFSESIAITQQKVSLIENIMKELCRKYGYKVQIAKAFHNLSSEGIDICSMACLIEKDR